MSREEELKKVIDRINKLRALATSSNPNEAAAAAAAAAKLIDAHRLSEAELEVGGQEGESPRIEDDPLETSHGAVIAKWKQWLANSLCNHFGVCLVRNKRWMGYRKSKSEYVIVGRPSDVTVVRYFYAWLTVEIERLCQKDKPKDGSGGVAWCSTYKNGAAAGVGQKLRELKAKERAAAPTSKAMVLLDSRYAQALQLYKQQPDVHLRKGGGDGIFGSDPLAFAKGVEAGKSIHLGQHLGSGDGTKVDDHKQLKGK